MLMKAAKVGKQEGLRFVYAGNLPVLVGDLENTRCPECQSLLIERFGYSILNYNINEMGCCPSCNYQIPGRWGPLLKKNKF